MYYLKGLNRQSFVDCSFFDKAGIAKMALVFLSEKMLDYWWLFQSLKKYFFNLQCCTPFFCTAKWLIFTHTYTLFFTFFSIKVYHQFSSVGHLCLTLCNPMDFSIPGFPDHHQLPERTQTHVHWVSDAIQHPQSLFSPFPPAFNLPSIRVFSNESVLHIRWPKYWSFSFSISPSNEYSGLISFRMEWLDLPTVQGTLKSLFQHHSSEASILHCSAFFIVQLSHPYMTTGKISLTRRTFVGQVMSLLLICCLDLSLLFSQGTSIFQLTSPTSPLLGCGTGPGT